MAGTVAAMEATAKGFANAVKRLAVQDKDFAMELAFIHNIRSQITPKALKQLTKDMFDKGGRLSEHGRQEVSRIIQDSGLGKNATWDDVLQAVRERKKAIEKAIAIKLPKLTFNNNVKKVCKSESIAAGNYKADKNCFSKIKVGFEEMIENVNKKHA